MDELLKRALKDFRNEYGRDFDSSWNPHSQQDLEDKLRSSKIDFDTWRSKHQRIWKSLSACAKPIQSIGSIAGDTLQGAYPPAGAAVQGLVGLVKISETVSNAYDFIEDMFTQLEEVLSRWNIDFRHDVDEHMKSSMQRVMVLLLSIITRSQKLMTQGRFRRAMANLVFGKDEKTAEFMEELEKSLQSEDRTRITLTLDRVNNLWEKAMYTEDAHVVERLNTPAAETNARTFAFKAEEKLVGSAVWYKEEGLYRRWVENEHPLLMMLGSQGTGKSFLATSLIEELTERFTLSDPESKQTSVAYFYFGGDADLVTMLKTMAYQIQATNPAFKRHVVDKFEQGNLYTAREVWTKLYLDFWTSSAPSRSRLVLVISGLGKASEDDVEMFAQEMVKDLVKNGGYNIQIAIFGRANLWAQFDYVPAENYIHISRSKNGTDLRAYIDAELKKMRLFRKSPEKERSEYREKIFDKCDGMFEWARSLLAKCKSQDKSRILKTLENPPGSLDDMIKDCFNQILDDDDIDPLALRTMLTWLTYSKRPIRFDELYNVVKRVTGEVYSLMWDHIVRKLSSIISWRKSRVRQLQGQEIDEDSIEFLENEEAAWSPEQSSTILFFSNSRIRDYVIQQSGSDKLSDSHLKKYPPPQIVAECEIVKTCLRTLLDSKMAEEDSQALLTYPSRYTMQHLAHIDLQSIEQGTKDEITNGLVQMLYSVEGRRALAIDGGKNRRGLAAFWRTWMEDNKYTDLLQYWFKDAVQRSMTFDEDVLSWVRLASASIKELWRPLIEFLRRVWLTHDYPPGEISDIAKIEPFFYLAIYLSMAYNHMDKSGHLPQRFSLFRVLDNQFFSIEDITSAAKASNLPEDANYLVSLAMALLGASHAAPAIRLLIRATNLDRKHWAAASFLSRAYMKTSRPSKALEWSKIAMELNPRARLGTENFRTLCHLGMNDRQTALDAAYAAYKLDEDHESSDTTILYLLGLSVHERWSQTLELVKELQAISEKKPTSDLLASTFTKRAFFADAETWTWGALGQVLTLSNSPQSKAYVLDAIQNAGAFISQNESSLVQMEFQMRVACFYCYFVENGMAKGLSLFEEVLNRAKKSTLALDMGDQTHLIVSILEEYAHALLEQARQQKLSVDANVSSTVDTLKRIALDALKIDRDLLTPIDRFVAVRTTLYYAIWLREDESSKGDWRKFFKEPILDNLATLDDESPHNDGAGILYSYLTLFLAADFESGRSLACVVSLKAIATYHQLDTDPEEADDTKDLTNALVNASPNRSISPISRTENFTQQDTLDHIEGSTVPESDSGSGSAERPKTSVLSLDVDATLACDTCGALMNYLDRLYTCGECLRDYCGRCKPISSAHFLLGRSCGHHHPFVQIWPVESKDIEAVLVMNGGTFEIRLDWLEAKRAEWKAVDDLEMLS